MRANIDPMERVHAVFFRVFIALAIAVDLIAVASLFMRAGSHWADARHFTLIFTAPAFCAYAWLRRHRPQSPVPLGRPPHGGPVP